MTAVDNIPTYLLTTAVFPVLLLILKTLLGNEIQYWMTLCDCYFYRPFDVDDNPKTHDWAMIHNSASGNWECCSLTFHFGFRKGGNGAFVHHYDDKWNLLFIERVPFGKWKTIGKGRISNPGLINGLEMKMIELALENSNVRD